MDKLFAKIVIDDEKLEELVKEAAKELYKKLTCEEYKEDKE